MKAVRRGLCDSSERGTGVWVRVGSPRGGSERQGVRQEVLSNCRGEKPSQGPRSPPASDQTP